MPEKIMGWLENFGGRNEYEITLHTGDVDFYAACVPNKGKYWWDMKRYNEYKNDESVTIYIAAHEAGHCYDKQFSRFGDYKPVYLWELGLLISIMLFVSFILIKGSIGSFGTLIWLINAFLIAMVLWGSDILYTPMELTAERFAMKYLGPGMVLHGQLTLSYIAYEEARQKERKCRTPFMCKAYLMSIEECLEELGIEYMEEK